jgi:hypothetical protein
MTKKSRARHMVLELELKYSIQRSNALELAKWSVENTIRTMASLDIESTKMLEYWKDIRRELELL